MTAEKTSQQIRMKDGRLLGFAEYGDPEGRPVFYFHGFPGSRLDWSFSDADNSAARLNSRIIAVDRPGMGLSDFLPGRELLDWPDDVVESADQLGLDRFAVLGISGGGPYAAACAYKIPERLTAAAIVSGMGPPEAPGMKKGISWTIPGKPSLVRKLLLMFFDIGLRKNPEQFVRRSKAQLPESDGEILDKPGVAKVYVEMMREAFRSGGGGVYEEAKLYRRPWKFKLQDISVETNLWHGELDLNVPISVGRYVAEAIPGCRSTMLKEEAHLSLPHNHIEQILGTLVR